MRKLHGSVSDPYNKQKYPWARYEPSWRPTMLSAMCSTRGGSQGMYITFASAMRTRQNPLWLWNPEETSPEIQNRGTSGLKIGHVNASDKKTKKKKKNINGKFKKAIATGSRINGWANSRWSWPTLLFRKTIIKEMAPADVNLMLTNLFFYM